MVWYDCLITLCVGALAKEQLLFDDWVESPAWHSTGISTHDLTSELSTSTWCKRLSTLAAHT